MSKQEGKQSKPKVSDATERMARYFQQEYLPSLAVQVSFYHFPVVTLRGGET